MSEDQAPSAQPARRGANAFFVASTFAQVSALLRYVILARMLGPEQLGLAATLVVMAAFFDLVGDTGTDRFLIQDRDGDQPEVQKLVHLVHVSRGITTAVALAVFAWPISLAYGTPKLAIGMALLGVSRLIIGFLHLDFRRVQRHLDFRSEAVALAWSEVAGLVFTGAAAYLTHNYTAILYGLTARAAVLVVVSHIRAHRPYRIGFSPEHAPRLTRFAVPLMLNGVLLFFATQGDRALVGHQLGMATLGRYSAILLLIMFPVATITRYTQAMYLPVLARHRDDAAERTRVAEVMGGQVLMLAVALCTGFAIVAPLAVQILYGARFKETAATVALIGFLQASRFLQVYPTVVALSAGRTVGPLAVNATRLAAYPAAFVGGITVGGLPGVLLGFVFGELLAQCVGLAMMNQVFGRPLYSGFSRVLLFILTGGAIETAIQVLQHDALPPKIAVFAGCGLLATLIALKERPAIRETIALVRRVTLGFSTRLARA